MERETFIRVVLAHRDRDSGLPAGPFETAYALRDEGRLRPDDHAALVQLIDWFRHNLAEPTRFGRTRSKGWYRRNTRGICWLRASPTEHVAKLRELATLLERAGCRVKELRETRIGYVVYEDEHQAVAEPFADTNVDWIERRHR